MAYNACDDPFKTAYGFVELSRFSDDRWQKVLGIQLQIYCVVYFRT